MADKRGRGAEQGKAGPKTPAGKPSEATSIFGLPLGGLVLGSAGAGAKGKKSGASGPRARLVVVGVGLTDGERSVETLSLLTKAGVDLDGWQRERFLKKRGEVFSLLGREGPVWVLAPVARPNGGHHGLLELSPYTLLRDLAGAVAGPALENAVSELSVSFLRASDDEILGTLVGLELGFYRFRTLRPGIVAGQARPSLVLDGASMPQLAAAQHLASATNLARHLVNLPPADLDPARYAAAAKDLFAGSTTMTVEIWDPKRVEKEGMGLLHGVGKGAAEGPRLVHMRYRPKGKTRSKQPLAFVGKGITFDTGGLDIKDAGSMRLMKKDMGGSASVLGLAYWAEQSELDVDCDFYLALAENAVDRHAFHPGDILRARNGQTVEIDNTDAEGRLVLADAFDVAISQKGKDAPAVLFDLATLTGAMRVGLGTRLAGMFATDDKLADALLRAGQLRGDPMWRMPLWTDYAVGLKSVVADVANSGPGRFGGAITAALFLARFVGQVPWVHIDMYGWAEGPGIGGLGEPGGNGQCVQALARFLETYKDG